MDINDFSKSIPSRIYERGEKYYENGYVSNIQNLGDGKWSADVEGNYDDYSVEIEFDNNKIIKSWQCNCPYEGAICKHVVAVLLTIKDEVASVNITKNGKQKQPEWMDIVNNTSEKELRDFVFEYAQKHRDFQDALIIHLAKTTKEIHIEKYQNIIAHIFDEASDGSGFIFYRDAYAAMRPVYDLLEKADDYLTIGSFCEAFSIAAAVVPECIQAIQNMDDSNGECGGAIYDAFNVVDKILHDCNDSQLSETIFNWIHKQINNRDYDDYGCGDQLEPIFFHWANTPERQKLAHDFIENQIHKSENDDSWSAQYKLTKYLKYKTELLVKEGNKDKAESLINSHLHLSEFRKMKIEQALDQNDFQSAIKHLQAGIKQAGKDSHQGIVHQFKDQLLDIYKQQKNQKNIRKISKELFYENRNSIDYYRIYKGTFPSEDWEKEREILIRSVLKKQTKSLLGYRFQTDLASIYIEEKMWDRLFENVKQANRIEITEQYSIYLKNDYPEELIIMYRNGILKHARNTGRNIYVDIIGYLKNMAKLNGGKVEAKQLMIELLETYKNRPAMKDEFRKLNWGI